MRTFKRCAPSNCEVPRESLRLALLHWPGCCSRRVTGNASPDIRGASTRLRDRCWSTADRRGVEMTLIFTINDQRSAPEIASCRDTRYLRLASVNPEAGIGVLTRRRTHRHKSGFFVSKAPVHLRGWTVGGLFGDTGTYVRHANPHGSALHDWRHGSGEKYRYIGASLMIFRQKLTLNPSKSRAAFHRACAIASLYSESSLSSRLKKFNSHMDRARALENAGGAQ